MLSRDRIPRLRDLIPRSSNFDGVFPYPHMLSNHPNRHTGIRIDSSSISSFFLFPSSTTRKICLVLSALSMSEVGAVILVNGKAETTFEASDVIFEEVGVFIEVNCFESKFTQTFAAIGVGC